MIVGLFSFLATVYVIVLLLSMDDTSVRGFRKLSHVLIRVVGAVVIGAIGVSLLWVSWLSSHDKTIGEAMRGEVEDGIRTLQGLLALAVFVGVPVGVVWSYVTLNQRNARK